MPWYVIMFFGSLLLLFCACFLPFFLDWTEGRNKCCPDCGAKLSWVPGGPHKGPTTWFWRCGMCHWGSEAYRGSKIDANPVKCSQNRR